MRSGSGPGSAGRTRTSYTEPPDQAGFEAIVLELDVATVVQCGLPLISAWDALAGGAGELPCWAETGLTQPAYTPAECTD